MQAGKVKLLRWFRNLETTDSRDCGLSDADGGMKTLD